MSMTRRKPLIKQSSMACLIARRVASPALAGTSAAARLMRCLFNDCRISVVTSQLDPAVSVQTTIEDMKHDHSENRDCQ